VSRILHTYNLSQADLCFSDIRMNANHLWSLHKPEAMGVLTHDARQHKTMTGMKTCEEDQEEKGKRNRGRR
jgi:hypothetical protein